MPAFEQLQHQTFESYVHQANHTAKSFPKHPNNQFNEAFIRGIRDSPSREKLRAALGNRASVPWKDMLSAMKDIGLLSRENEAEKPRKRRRL